MPGLPFPLPKSSTPGARAGEGEGRYVNCYASIEGERVYVRRTPGLARLVATGGSGVFRGGIDVNGAIYVVFGTTAYRIAPNLTVTTLSGSITGSDGLTFARNNKVTDDVATPDVVAVRDGGGAYILTSSAVSAYSDSDLPTTVNSVTFLEGYFIFSLPDGRMFSSGLNTTDVEALDFATAEGRADGLKRVIVRGNILYAMGETTIEPWKNVGNLLFPLQRAPTVMQVGLLTTMGAAGFEDSWNSPCFFVSSDRRVMALAGYETLPVSTADVERFLTASTASAIEVSALIWKGRPFIAISSNVGTWVYDVESKAWHERSSIGASRWRASLSFFSSGRWVFGDTLSADLMVMSDTLLENGAAHGGFVQTGQLKDFPANIAAKLSADFTEANITVSVSWSHDGAKTWCAAPLSRSLANAEKWPVEVANLGRSTHAGLIVKFSWEGAADFSFMGASAMRAQAGGE